MDVVVCESAGAKVVFVCSNLLCKTLAIDLLEASSKPGIIIDAARLLVDKSALSGF